MTEERERQERRLGDLTEEIAAERGELVIGPALESPAFIQPAVALSGVPLPPIVGINVPPHEKQTVTVFDARPLNAKDFYVTDTQYMYPIV